MTVLIVQYQIRDDARPPFAAAVGTLMAAVAEAAPDGIRYTLGTLPDGVTVVGLLELDDGVENPLLGLPAAGAFQRDLAGWVVGDPPAAVRLDVLGSYGRDG